MENLMVARNMHVRILISHAGKMWYVVSKKKKDWISGYVFVVQNITINIFIM